MGACARCGQTWACPSQDDGVGNESVVKGCPGALAVCEISVRGRARGTHESTSHALNAVFVTGSASEAEKNRLYQQTQAQHSLRPAVLRPAYTQSTLSSLPKTKHAKPPTARHSAALARNASARLLTGKRLRETGRAFGRLQPLVLVHFRHVCSRMFAHFYCPQHRRRSPAADTCRLHSAQQEMRS